jgi:hypothetical protein
MLSIDGSVLCSAAGSVYRLNDGGPRPKMVLAFDIVESSVVTCSR